MNIVSITKNGPDYPDRLRQLYNQPERLFSCGASLNALLDLPSIGIVGSRKVTSYGRTVTEEITSYLARRGILIISGLAYGVDSLAHQAAVSANGKTIAVLPGGIGKIYPAAHHNLATKIIHTGGSLISEYPAKNLPMKHHFIERNRIIAALSDALLITEAAEKSGSLHTARFALELGKPVLAVPGDIYRPTSKGCNNLIKMGATPISSPEEALEALGLSEDKRSEENAYYPSDKFEQAILELMKNGETDGSLLLKASALDTSDFQQTLTMLEIKGVIGPSGNNRWHLR